MKYKILGLLSDLKQTAQCFVNVIYLTSVNCITKWPVYLSDISTNQHRQKTVFFVFTNHETAEEEGGHFFTSSLDISCVITAESSPLHIGSSQTRNGNL